MIFQLQPSADAFHGSLLLGQTPPIPIATGDGQQAFLPLAACQFPEQFPLHRPVPPFHEAVKYGRHAPAVRLTGGLMPNVRFPLGEVKNSRQKDGEDQRPQNVQPAKHSSDYRRMLTDSGTTGKQKAHLPPGAVPFA